MTSTTDIKTTETGIIKRIHTKKDGTTTTTYRARYRDSSGKERVASRKKFSEARKVRNAALTSVDKGDWIDPRLAKVTLEFWSEKWFATKAARKPKTIEGYDSLLRCHILPRFGTYPLDRISHADVAAWLADLTASGLSASRTRQAHQCLSAILAFAVRDGRLTKNVADGVDLPTLPDNEMRHLDPEEVATLAEATGRYRVFIYWQAYVGTRWGEAAALRRHRLDLVRGRAQIVESISEVNGKLITGPTKNHQRREVVIPRFLVDMLVEHCAGMEPDALVFTSPKGCPLRESNFRRSVWVPALHQAGIDYLRVHDLRHTAASLMRAAGADALLISKQLGHKDPTVTQRIYSHLFADERDSIATLLDDLHSRATQKRPKAVGEIVQFPENR